MTGKVSRLGPNLLKRLIFFSDYYACWDKVKRLLELRAMAVEFNLSRFERCDGEEDNGDDSDCLN